MNLLTDPILRIEKPGEMLSLDLPTLLEALGSEDVMGFAGLQRHQEDALHVFLSSLAAAILARGGSAKPMHDADFWRRGLRDLAGDARDDAWCLVVDDLSRPAFMQPPLPKADHQRLKPLARTPDGLDLLPTARNHDIKQSRSLRARADAWFYALVSLQTMSGQYGRGQPGISRMNTGYGNRSVVEMIRDPAPGPRWRDAVERLLLHRRQILEEPFGFDAQGLVLVWLEPWDGSQGISLSLLDPLYIEICRRVRLIRDEHGMSAANTTAEAPRIDAKRMRGVVGDGWLPIDLGKRGRGEGQEEKALTFSAQGITPEHLRRLVFGDGVRLTPLQLPGSGWHERAWLRVSVLIRGQGTTDGFHEQSVLLPRKIQRRLFGSPGARDCLADLSRTAIEYAGVMQNRVLKPSSFTYLQAGPETLDFDQDAAKSAWERFARSFANRWSVEFFPWLWSVPEEFDEEEVLEAWALRLRDHALEILKELQASVAIHTGRRYRAAASAERVFWGALYNRFPLLGRGGDT